MVDDGYNGRSISEILREILLLENGRYVYENGMPADGKAGIDVPGASLNILNLGRELEEMEMRRKLQEQKEQAMEMVRQADRARAKSREDFERKAMQQAQQAQQAAQRRQPPPPEPEKKKITPPTPSGNFNRKINWKE